MMTQRNYAEQWRNRNQGQEITLPSGLLALVRHPKAMSTILRSGKIPDALAARVAGAFGAPTTAVKPAKDTKDDLAGIADLLDTIARASLVLPKVVEVGVEPNYDANEISIDDLDDEDKMWLLEFGMGGAVSPQVARFPEQSVGSVDAGQGSESISPAPLNITQE